MTETPPKHRLPTLWRWLLGLGVPTISLFLGIALSYRQLNGWPLLIFPLGLAIGPGIIAGLGTVSLRTGRYLAYAVAIVSLLAWTISYWAVEADNTLIALLSTPLYLVLGLALTIGVGIALGIAIAQWRAVGIHAIHPLLVYLVVMVFAWLVPIGGVIRLPSRHSDAAMEAHFWQHREQFDQLARMSNEDSLMTVITYDSTYSRTSIEPLFSEERWGQYRNLFREISLTRGLRRREDGAIIFTYREGYLGLRKGYVYSEKPLQPSVDSLEDTKVSSESIETIYKKIDENWYMYRS